MVSCLSFSALVVAVVVVLYPAYNSEQECGWTKKYTSPQPIFTKSDIQDLSGKVAIVTGANTGIGYHTALELARNGATVVVAARNAQKGKAAVEKIQNEIIGFKSGGKAKFLPLDLSSLKSVKEFATSFMNLNIPLHMLVLNAGIMKSPGASYVGGKLFQSGFETTVDGFEAHIGVNHIAHFYLTQLLTPILKDSSPSRVVSITSQSEKEAYKPDGVRFSTWKPSVKNGEIPEDYEDGVAYGQSKLANILFASEFAKRMKGTGVTAYSVHPGRVDTELTSHLISEMGKDFESLGRAGEVIFSFFVEFDRMSNFQVEDGALTQLLIATADPTKLVNGGYYHPIGTLLETPMHPQGSNEKLQKLVWTETERMVAEANF